MSYKWTDEKPTEPGWYWWRYSEDYGVVTRIVSVLQISIDTGYLALGQWSSTPIPLPEEPR